MVRLKMLHFGFGAPELFSTQPPVMKGNGDGFENSLRNVASHNGLAYLTSPQIGAFWKTLVMLKRPYLRDAKWSGYKNLRNSHFSAFLNFEIEDKSIEQAQLWEEVYGYPGIRLLMQRSLKIRAKYQTQGKFDKKVEQFKGFEAELMQQAHNHLEAIDPLMLALDIEVTEPILKQEHQSNLKELLGEFKSERQKLRADGQFNQFKRTTTFNKLRRQVVYSITDRFRK